MDLLDPTVERRASLWTREGHREVGKIGHIDVHEILCGNKTLFSTQF